MERTWIAVNENNIKLLFSVIQSALFGNPIPEESKSYATDINAVQSVLAVAQKHDVAHIVAYGLLNNEPASDADNKLHLHTYRAIYQYKTLNYELTRIVEALEKAQIPFIPLKGSVIRKYYPEPWMRNSCDIDVLVHKEDLDAAILCLVKNLGYTEGDRATHDVSLFGPQRVHIELHFDLVEEGRAKGAIDVLKDVWDNVSVHQDYNYWYEMTDAYFYFYHIAHMAKHFESGGCGIRPFIDLWILDHLDGADTTARDALLSRGNLLKFTAVARELSEAWLGGKEANELTLQMQNFILSGGVYGSTDNRVALQQKKKGGRIGYVISRIFVPYDKLKRYYPILEKHRWLMPLMQIRRWFMLFKPSVAKMAKRELALNSSLEKAKSDEMNAFLDDIGLN